MIFILTGPVHSGKTTLLNRVVYELKKQGVKIDDFLSKAIEEIEETLGYDLFDLKEESFAFLEAILSLPQLVIAGAEHIGQALAHLGNLLDFEATVIDDRPEFANKERLPDLVHSQIKSKKGETE